MTTATFRFYAELNDFLPPSRRQREIAAPCARNATLKHMVEALGVPHTEVALLLVNGEAAAPDRLIADGDRVAVYPPLARLDIATSDPGEPRFIADAHMGGLAHLLRMCGFDTLYDNNYADAEIEAIAAREERIVLTRDRELLKRRTIARGCYVHALKPQQQVAEVFARYGLAGRARPFALCLACNAPLHAIARDEVEGRVPDGVFARQQKFSTCDACHRVFWEGSHWQHMQTVLAGLCGSGN